MATDALTLLKRLTTRGRIRHMQALIVLDDKRSMSRAAETMGMTQPGMTQLVNELEQLLDTVLFLRHARGVAPTLAAQALLPVARRIISASEDGAEVIASHNRRDGGLVRIAATVAAQGAMLPPILPAFVDDHPDIQLQIEDVIGQTLDAAFNGEVFDLICCRRQTVVPDEWVWQVCRNDVLAVICGASHPMAGGGWADMDQLADQHWLLNHVSSLARHHFDDLARKAGWQSIRSVQVISRIPLLIRVMLGSSRTVSLLPESAVEPWLASGEMVRLDSPMTLPLEPLGYYWRPENAGRATRTLANRLMLSGNLPLAEER